MYVLYIHAEENCPGQLHVGTYKPGLLYKFDRGNLILGVRDTLIKIYTAIDPSILIGR